MQRATYTSSHAHCSVRPRATSFSPPPPEGTNNQVINHVARSPRSTRGVPAGPGVIDCACLRLITPLPLASVRQCCRPSARTAAGRRGTVPAWLCSRHSLCSGPPARRRLPWPSTARDRARGR